jgi:acyl-CoA synthetase (NDP forming)
MVDVTISDNENTLSKLKRGFNPRNIAVVGAARHNRFFWLKNHLPFHKKHGKLFHVNIDKNEWAGAEALGIQSFSSLIDIPDAIDYVTVSVPREIVPIVLQDCIKKGVAVAHVYAAGFGETGEPEGTRLDQIVKDMAQKANLTVVGPNCMGLFNPSLGIRQLETQYHTKSGNFGFISQSGSQATGVTLEAYAYGIKVSKCISMGNGLVVDTHDLIDYLAEDDETTVIGMYLEGLRDPSRFFRSLRDACKKKPVLIWKVGQTEDAARASEAHSGTSNLRQELWEDLLVRCGAIAVNSLEELIDTTKAIGTLPPAIGVNAGLFAISGGHSTEMANVFSKCGFRIPRLTEQSYDKLSSLVSLIGGNYVNPIQVFGETFNEILEVLSKDDNLDIVAVEVAGGRLSQSEKILAKSIQQIKNFQMNSVKPIIAIVTSSFPRIESSVMESILQRFNEEGIPAFPTFQRGAMALKNVVDYYSRKAYLPD